MALARNSLESYGSINYAADTLMRELDYRLQRQIEEMQYRYQMNMAYPIYQTGIPVSTSPQKDEKKEKLHRLIAHYYHARK